MLNPRLILKRHPKRFKQTKILIIAFFLIIKIFEDGSFKPPGEF